MVDCHSWSNQLEAGCGQKIHGFLLCFHHPHCQIQQPVKMATKGISDILLCNESDEVSPEKVEQRGKFKVGGNREKCDVLLPWQQSFWITTIGSLSNNNGDSNENVKKKWIIQICKTTTMHVITLFLYISQPSLHDSDIKLPNFMYISFIFYHKFVFLIEIFEKQIPPNYSLLCKNYFV